MSWCTRRRPLVPLPVTPPETWTLIERARASFDPARSGDLLVLLKPRVTPIERPAPGYVETHGSPWDYDRRVPIVVWRKGMTPTATNDWADTIAHLSPAQQLQALTALHALGKALPQGEIASPALQTLQQLLPAPELAALLEALDLFEFERALECVRTLSTRLETCVDDQPHARLAPQP